MRYWIIYDYTICPLVTGSSGSGSSPMQPHYDPNNVINTGAKYDPNAANSGMGASSGGSSPSFANGMGMNAQQQLPPGTAAFGSSGSSSGSSGSGPSSSGSGSGSGSSPSGTGQTGSSSASSFGSSSSGQSAGRSTGDKRLDLGAQKNRHTERRFL